MQVLKKYNKYKFLNRSWKSKLIVMHELIDQLFSQTYIRLLMHAFEACLVRQPMN